MDCATYGAMKTAIGGFVRSMAMELAPYNIRINAVAPETTETEQVNPRAFTHPQYLQHWDVWNPMGRWGQPRDTAAAVLYLASGLSDWVTGTTIHVDGGALAAGLQDGVVIALRAPRRRFNHFMTTLSLISSLTRAPAKAQTATEKKQITR